MLMRAEILGAVESEPSGLSSGLPFESSGDAGPRGMTTVDRELVVRAQNGDRGAFTTLATARYGRLHRIAYTILRDTHLAEDATQQTMLKVWTQLPRLRDPDRFDGWVHRTLVNTCMREGGKASRLVPDLGLRTEQVVAIDDIGTVIDGSSSTEASSDCRSSTARSWCSSTTLIFHWRP